MKQKMTRQQRRKMEREMRKNKNKSIEDFPTIYSWTITDLETLRKYKSGFNTIDKSLKSHFDEKYSQNDVYMTTVKVDFEENGIVSPGIVRIIHDSGTNTNSTHDIQGLLKMVLTITVFLLKVKNIFLTEYTEFTFTIGHSVHLNFPLYESPDMLDYIDDDRKTLENLDIGLKNTGWSTDLMGLFNLKSRPTTIE